MADEPVKSENASTPQGTPNTGTPAETGEDEGNTTDEGEELPDDDAIEYETIDAEEEEEEVEEEEFIIHQEDYFSFPKLSVFSTLSPNVVQFDYSFGYDASKHFNICVAEEHTLIFGSGNYLHIYNTLDQQVTLIRSPLGGSYGHIIKNPNPEYNHIAIGVNGPEPPILIYEWPCMEIIFVLKEGTTRSYSNLNYSPDGLLLASQGGEPDFNITIWDWLKHHIMLRIKSFFNDVITVMFSPYCPGLLTSGGLGHIKFWKMAETFTGLKLKGELGRFGKTEICDIIGVYPMPDEKVLSGCDWGNILVWDEGLIKIEVCRKNRARCHNGPITQFEYNLDSNEISTISMDGWVRVWYWETVELADPPDDDRFVEIDPIYEFNIGTEDIPVSIMSLVRQNAQLEEDNMWYAQDAKGGIWLADLSTDEIPGAKPKQVLKCHGGEVAKISPSPCSTHMVSLGLHGDILLYNYATRRILVEYSCISKGGDILWLPLEADSTGTIIALGSDDGVLRLLHANITKDTKTSFGDGGTLSIIQAIKPHSASITRVAVNAKGSVLVTGSKDKTIFIFQINKSDTYIQVEPIGFIDVPDVVSFITWKPRVVATVFVCTTNGCCIEADLPETTRSYTNVSFFLQHIVKREFKFRSCKAEIRRELKIKATEKRKADKLKRKTEELFQLRDKNPGMEYDSEMYLADSESTEELTPLYYPPIPNTIYWALYTPKETVWLNLAGYDAGYIYEYDAAKKSQVKATMIYEADDIQIVTFALYYNNKYIAFGMEDGSIRFTRFKEADFHNTNDFWTFNMHDNFRGRINTICFSFDGRYMFTGGEDGNIFSYLINLERSEYPRVTKTKEDTLGMLPIVVSDIDDPELLSLEAVKKKAKYDEKMRIANLRKNKVLDILASYRNVFRKLLKRNRALLVSQMLTNEDFELDDRVTYDLDDMLESEMRLVERKLGFSLEKSKLGLHKVKHFFTDPMKHMQIEVLAIRSEVSVQTFRIRKIDEHFFYAKHDLIRRIEDDVSGGRKMEVKVEESETEMEEGLKIRQIESFLMGLSPSTIEYKMGYQINRLLRKYRERKAKLAKRQKEWDKLYAVKPDEKKNHPNDIASLEEAKKTIGDYKLKSDPTYKMPSGRKVTKLSKYYQLLEIREELFKMRNKFNDRVLELREQKLQLISQVDTMKNLLLDIQLELPKNRIKPLPETPKLDKDREFVERNLKLRVAQSDAFTTKRRRSTFVEKIKPLVMQLDLEKEVLSVSTCPPDMDMSISEIQKEVVEYSKTIENLKLTDLAMFHVTMLQELGKSDDIDTPWETEMKRTRLTKKLFDQDEVLAQIDDLIRKFDENVQYLNKCRLQVDVDAKYKELFLLTLHQELIILKEFEANEEKLGEKVQEKQNEKNVVIEKQQQLQHNIETRQRNIAKIGEKSKEIQQQFIAAISDSKFQDFLKGIFKRKYKPPKDPDADSDEDSSSSSSSSSEDEAADAASLDSDDIGPIKLDESVCPPGCDPVVFDLTYELRTQRHQLELNEREELRQIELTHKEINALYKNIKLIDNALKLRLDDLEAYQHLKQEKLNEVNVTCILKMKQLQHLRPDGTLEEIENSLVFSESVVGSLYNRVGELKVETEEQKEKHRKNMRHLSRMKQDCGYMAGHIRTLKDNIKDLMMKKFNKVVNLTELEEAVLKKLVHELKLKLGDVSREYDKEISRWKESQCEKQIDYMNMMQLNTDKLEVLRILEEETLKLSTLLRNQSDSKGMMETIQEKEAEYKSDLDTLKNIARRQECQILELKKEIKKLSMKSQPLPPIQRDADELKSVSEDSFSYFSFSQYPCPREKELAETTFSETASHISVPEHELAGIIQDIAEKKEQSSGELTVMEILEDITSRIGSDDSVKRQVIESLLTVPGDDGSGALITIKEIIDHLLSKIGLEADEEDNLEVDVLKMVIDEMPVKPEEKEAVIEKLVDELIQKLPIQVVEQTSAEDLRTESRKVVHDIMDELLTIPFKMTMDVVESVMQDGEYDPQRQDYKLVEGDQDVTESAKREEEAQFLLEIIDVVIETAFKRVKPSESTIQLAVEAIVQTMIEFIPEDLDTVYENIHIVGQQLLKTMTLCSVDILQVNIPEVVENIVAFIEREGPEQFTKCKVEQIVTNLIEYTKQQIMLKEKEEEEARLKAEQDAANIETKTKKKCRKKK